MSSVPTDSVLRRHHEQMRQAARSVPTDSVLRRHHDQVQQAARLEAESSRAAEPAERTPAPEAAAPASPAPEAAEPASPEPQPAARPADTPAPAVSAQGGGGFMGWLKRLFGG
jgi:hypothetical protein